MMATAVQLDEVLTHIGFGKWQVQIVPILCVGSIADAIEVNLLAFLAPCVQEEFSLTYFQTSSLTGVVFLGELIGAFFFGSFADNFGRRSAYLISLCVTFLFGVATFFATGYASLALLRSLVGFGIGGICVPFDYLAEVSPAKHRGKLCLVAGFCWGVGSVLITCFAWILLPHFGWRALTLAAAAPVALAAAAAAAVLGESPRWLLARGRQAEALQALRRASYLNNVELPPDLVLAEPNKETAAAAPAPGMGGLRKLFQGHLLRPTLSLGCIWICFGFSYFAVILFIGRLFKSAAAAGATGGACSFDYPSLAAAALSEPLFLLLGFVVIERSRRGTHAATYLLAGMSTLLLASTGVAGSSAALAVWAFLARGNAALASSTTWIVTPEHYPTETRAQAHSFQYILARVGAGLSSFWVSAADSSFLTAFLIAILFFVASFAASTLEETTQLLLDDLQGGTPAIEERKRLRSCEQHGVEGGLMTGQRDLGRQEGGGSEEGSPDKY